MKHAYKKLTFIFLFISGMQAHAQKKILQESPIMVSQGYRPGVFGEDAAFFYSSYVITGQMPGLFIEKIDKKTLAVTSSKEVSQFAQMGSKMENPDPHFFLIKDKIYCFYQQKRKDTVYVFLQIIQPNGEISGLYNVLKTQTTVPVLSTIIQFSPDNESFFIAPGCRYSSVYDSRIPAGQNWKLYKTSTLEVIWSRDFSSDLDTYSPRVSNYILDNKNNLYFLVYKKHRELLCELSVASPTLKTFPDLIGSTLIVETAALHLKNDGSLLFAGISADSVKNENASWKNPRMFMRIVDANDLSVKLTRDDLLTDDVLGKLSVSESNGKPDAEKKKFHIVPYTVFEHFLINESEDGYYYTTEDVFHDVYKGGTLHKDIVILKTSKDGELKYSSVIPRCQRALWKIPITVQTFLLNKQLYVLLGEDETLANKKMTEYTSGNMPVMKENEGNVIVVNTADDGTLTKQVLFKNYDVDFMYNYQDPLMYDKNKLLFMLLSKEKLNKIVVYSLVD